MTRAFVSISMALWIVLASVAPGFGDDAEEEVVPDFRYSKTIKIDTVRTKTLDTLAFFGTVHPREIKITGKKSVKLQYPRSGTDVRTLEMRMDRLRNRPKKRAPSSERETQSSGIVKATLSLLPGEAFPPDGTIAVSTTGFVVAADNNGINFFANDSLLSQFSYPDFFASVGGAQIATCDPKVIYDPEENKFIFLIQTTVTDPTDSQLFIAFSMSDNPTDGWRIFPFRSWPENRWFDYPGLSVNYKEFVITGNLIETTDFFGLKTDSIRENLVALIPKDPGYDGAAQLEGIVWINRVPGQSIIPVPAARDRMYGPGTYLLSTSQDWFNNLLVYKITGHTYHNPDLIVLHGLAIEDYTDDFRPLVDQPNGLLLDAGDNRIKSAYYQNGKLYFAFHKNDGHEVYGISFNRIRLSDMRIKRKFFHDNQMSHYAFPAITNRLDNEPYSRAVLVYLRSGINTFPQVRLRYLRGDMSGQGRSITVLPGDFVCNDSRWGDYIAVQKRYGHDEAWLIGHIATSDNVFQSHILRVALP